MGPYVPAEGLENSNPHRQSLNYGYKIVLLMYNKIERSESMKKFYMKQKVFSFRDSFKVYNENQNEVYRAHAKMMSFARQYQIFKSENEQLLFTMRRRLFSFMPRYELFDAENKLVAVMHKRFAAFKNRIDIEAEGQSYLLEGSICAHNFTISNAGEPIVAVRKKLLSWGDTYEIEVADNADIDKMIAFVLMIDSIYHRKKSSNSSSRRR